MQNTLSLPALEKMLVLSFLPVGVDYCKTEFHTQVLRDPQTVQIFTASELLTHLNQRMKNNEYFMQFWELKMSKNVDC